MKFAGLPVGAQFVYQGEAYNKLNAIMAVHAETGKQKLIPRFAEVDVAGGVSADMHDASVSLDAACEEFRRWYAECRAYLQGVVDEDRREEVLKTLDEASEAFVQRLAAQGKDDPIPGHP